MMLLVWCIHTLSLVLGRFARLYTDSNAHLGTLMNSINSEGIWWACIICLFWTTVLSLQTSFGRRGESWSLVLAFDFWSVIHVERLIGLISKLTNTIWLPLLLLRKEFLRRTCLDQISLYQTCREIKCLSSRKILGEWRIFSLRCLYYRLCFLSCAHDAILLHIIARTRAVVFMTLYLIRLIWIG